MTRTTSPLPGVTNAQTSWSLAATRIRSSAPVGRLCELGQCDALDAALARDEKEEALGRGLGQDEHGGDAIAPAVAGQVGEMAAPFLGDFMDGEAAAASVNGKDVEEIARVGRQQGERCVLTRLAQAGAADAAEVPAAQFAVGAQGDPDPAVGQQIGGGEGTLCAFDDLCAAAVGVLLALGQKLIAHDA